MTKSAPPDTRQCLISAAEKLFAANGIDAVSLREINRASGARNSIAVQYHFRDRAGVVRAILDKHEPEVDSRRHAMLDELEARGPADLRDMATALVRPLASKLADRDGGPEFLAIFAEVVNRPRPPVVQSLGGSMRRWSSMLDPLLDEHAKRMRLSYTAVRFAAAELGRRAATGLPPIGHALFVSRLADLVTAIMAAPISDETLRADDRPRRPSTRTTPRGKP